jgi:DegV family protein with EDD domain
MVRIITDSSTLYTKAEATAMGFDVTMLCVTINGRTYRELEEINTEEFIRIIHQGHIPVSSQPALGEVLELYNKYPKDELLNITIANGLSGTFQTACSAVEMAENPRRITVFNSRTLCYPQRYLVEKANELSKRGKNVQAIVVEMEQLVSTSKSYLIPRDFDYLRRGGRLSPFIAHIGKLIKLAPVMTQTEDGKQLTRLSIQRSFKRAVHTIAEDLMRLGVDETYQIAISHSLAEDSLQISEEIIGIAFPKTKILKFTLSPAFTVQGGPGCVAIQAIKMRDFS